MTKRWLSLLLVLMLAIPTFGMSALAAGLTIDDTTVNADTGAVTVKITPDPTTASVRYTYGTSASIDEPTEISGTVYTGPFTLTEYGTYYVKAIQYGANVTVARKEVTVIVSKPLATGVSINPVLSTINGHATATLTATVTPAAAEQKVTWNVPTSAIYSIKGTPTDTQIVIESNGTNDQSTGLEVTATANGITKKAMIFTKEELFGDIEAPVSLSVAKGETIEFNARVTPDNVSIAYKNLTAALYPATPACIEIVGNPVENADFSYTYKIKGVAVGSQGVRLTAAINGKTLTVPVTVTEKGAAAPIPELGKPSGTVFTSADPTKNVITVKSADDQTAATLQYRLDTEADTAWKPTGASIEIGTSDSITDLNKTYTILFRNKATEGAGYTEDSETVTATYTSAVATASIDPISAVSVAGIVNTPFAVVLNDDNGGINVNDKSATFVSNNTAVATVDYNPGIADKLHGVIKTVGEGTATVKVTSGDGLKSVDIAVTAGAAKVDAMKVTKGSDATDLADGAQINLNVGEAVTLTAEMLANSTAENVAYNQKATWTIAPADANYFTVEDGKITALAAGNAKLTVASVETPTVKRTYDVYVLAPASKLYAPYMTPTTNAEPWEPALKDINLKHFNTGAPAAARIYYTIDGTEPTLDSKNVANDTVVSVGPTTTTLKAKVFMEGYTASDTKTEVYTFKVYPTAIKLDKVTADMVIGDTLTLTPTITPDNASEKTVTWSTSASAIATVANGVVTAVAGGTATITASVKDKDGVVLSGTCVVTVIEKPVSDLVLTPTAVELTVGNTRNLFYTATENKAIAKATLITWVPADATVVSVTEGTCTATSGSASIMGLKEGKTVVTLTVNGTVATCEVTVTAKPVEEPGKPTAVTFTKATAPFEVEANTEAELVLGTLTAAARETLSQAFYYGQFTVEIKDEGGYKPKAFGTMPTCSASVNADGTIVLTVPNVGDKPVIFDAKVIYTVNTQANDALWDAFKFNGTELDAYDATKGTRTCFNEFTNYKLLIVDVIKFVGATLEPIEGVFTEIDETVVMGNIENYTALKDKGYALTVKASETGDAWTAAIADNGDVTLAIKAPDVGEYEVTVTIEAKNASTNEVLNPVTTEAQKVSAKNFGIIVDSYEFAEQEMFENETWKNEVGKVENIAVLKAGGYTVGVESYVLTKDGAVSVTVTEDWKATISELGVITLEVTQPDVGEYEACVKVSAVNAEGVKLTEVFTKAIDFVVVEEGFGGIVTENGCFAYDKDGYMNLAKSQLTGVRFVLTNGRAATWTTSNKVISISGDGYATFSPKKGSRCKISATYTDKDGDTVTVSQRIKLIKVDSAFKLKKKVGRKSYNGISNNTVNVDISGTPIVKVKLIGKHGPGTSITWLASNDADGDEVIKVNENGAICLLTPQKIGTCNLMVVDFTGASKTITVNVVADLKDVEPEATTEKVNDFIEIG